MRHGTWYCVLVGSMAGLTGCGWLGGSANAPQGGVAVVDLDEIAKSVGANARLAEMVKMRQTSLNNQLEEKKTELQDELSDSFKDIKEKYATDDEKLSAEDAKTLRADSIKANAKLQQYRTSAQVDLNTFTEQLKQQFRSEIRPIAQEIAQTKGFSIVVPKNDALLLSVAPGNDITNEVILALQARNQKALAEAKANPPAKQPAAAPAKSSKKKTDESKTAEAPREEIQE